MWEGEGGCRGRRGQREGGKGAGDPRREDGGWPGVREASHPDIEAGVRAGTLLIMLTRCLEMEQFRKRLHENIKHICPEAKTQFTELMSIDSMCIWAIFM